MADQNTGLPVRSEADGTDERVLSKIQDGADPGGVDKTAEVSEKLVHIRAHGEDPGATKRQLKLSEEGHANSDGDYDASTNTKPSSSALVAHDRGASIDETSQNQRVTAVAGADNTVCLDIALRDEAGASYSITNPLPVEPISDQTGDEICDYNTSAAVAKDASVNHDYTVTAAKTLLCEQVWASGSGKIKVEVLINAATVFVGFNSTANPNVEIPMSKLCKGNATEVVRITITNRDNQAQDVYSTLTGIEI